MLIGDLFERDVVRAIPPVVYFHEQEPAELAREVEEYIITGGYPAGSARATEGGIHEQFVRLLEAMHAEMKTKTAGAGPRLPACWISGLYGSGKSSFAKLLGLALDQRKLPDGRLLSEALLARDQSPGAADFARAWAFLLDGIKPVAVVFDIGSRARDDEHIHTVVVRQVQQRLGYSATSQLVANHELLLELEGLYGAFLDKVAQVHAKTWTQLKDSPLAEDYFSAALHALQPDLYRDPMSWIDARSGSRFDGKRSADEAAVALQQMMAQRLPGRTLFLVVDEVSQYVHDDSARMLGLQSFVEAIGERMKGDVWLLATGQQRLEDEAGVARAVVKMKDRFPPSLRVHLGVANIRDVVHKRLLKKHKISERDLEDLFAKHRNDLALYAYRGDQIVGTDFAEIYPLLPGQIDLLLDITTGLRSRAGGRTQGDASAIRGLLQLLGDLFREKRLAQYEVGRLITVDMIYDLLQSALDPDVQMTLSRALDFCARQQDPLTLRVVKAVAMLELVQEHQKTSPELIARCLYEKLGDGNALPAVEKALDVLRGEALLGYSERTGYKIESSAGQEWQRERDGFEPGAEAQSEAVQKALDLLISDAEKPALEGLALPWLVLFSDYAGARDAHLRDDRKHTVVTVDLQLTKGEGADVWGPRSETAAYVDRLVWVVGELDAVSYAAKQLLRSARMVERYGSRQHSASDDKQRLLIEERNRHDVALRELSVAVSAAFMSGQLYWRGRAWSARDGGSSFKLALETFGSRVARDLYPNPTTYSVTEKDVLYLIDNTELAAPPPVLGQDRLGVLTLDAGRYEVTCTGRIPSGVLAYVKELEGVTGGSLLAHFGAPPHGVPPDVLRAAVLGLLRAGKIRVELPGVGELTSVRDEGVRELTKDSGLRKAKLTVNEREDLSARDRNAICTLFKEQLGKDVARDKEAIADATVERFMLVRERLTKLGESFRKLPRDVAYPEALDKLESAIESCRRDRKVEPTVLAVKRHLNVLRDGLVLLRRMETDLTDKAVAAVRQADDVWRLTWPQLAAVGASDEARASASLLEVHLKAERPWEDAGDLLVHVARLREEYRARRGAVLEAHEKAVESAVDALKRSAGFEQLDPDQRHAVLRHVREGAASNTDDHAIAPALEALGAHLAARLENGKQKAQAQLDDVLERLGGAPIVEIAIALSGREIDSEADLDRWLGELRERVAHELAAHHRVRLKGS